MAINRIYPPDTRTAALHEATPLGKLTGQPESVQTAVETALSAAAEPEATTPAPMAPSEENAPLAPTKVKVNQVTELTGPIGLGPFVLTMNSDGFTVTRTAPEGGVNARQKQVYLSVPAGPGKQLVVFMAYSDDEGSPEAEPEHAHDVVDVGAGEVSQEPPTTPTGEAGMT